MFTKIIIIAMLFILLKQQIQMTISEDHEIGLLILIFFSIGIDLLWDRLSGK